MTTKRIKFEDIKKQKGATDKHALDKMTDAEIAKRALGDRDTPVPTKKELKEFQRVGRKDKPRGRHD